MQLNAEYNSIYQHTKFEQNLFVNVHMHTNVEVFFYAISKIIYQHTKFEQNLFVNVQMHTNVEVFFMQSVKL